MRALLDTHTFLWWLADDSRLSGVAKAFIGNSQNEIFFSVVSAWEITIKVKSGKLPLPEPPNIYIPKYIARYNFKILDIDMESTLQIWKLEKHHKDPFDRMLVAQSQTKKISILTCDNKFPSYDVKIIW